MGTHFSVTLSASPVGSMGVQHRELWPEEEEDEEARPHHLPVCGLLLECHCCREGNRVWSSPSLPTL